MVVGHGDGESILRRVRSGIRCVGETPVCGEGDGAFGGGGGVGQWVGVGVGGGQGAGDGLIFGRGFAVGGVAACFV